MYETVEFTVEARIYHGEGKNDYEVLKQHSLEMDVPLDLQSVPVPAKGSKLAALLDLCMDMSIPLEDKVDQFEAALEQLHEIEDMIALR